MLISNQTIKLFSSGDSVSLSGTFFIVFHSFLDFSSSHHALQIYLTTSSIIFRDFTVSSSTRNCGVVRSFILHKHNSGTDACALLFPPLPFTLIQQIPTPVKKIFYNVLYILCSQSCISIYSLSLLSLLTGMKNKQLFFTQSSVAQCPWSLLLL